MDSHQKRHTMYIMRSHIQKWGNTLVVPIPARFAKELHLHPGSPVFLKIEQGRIIVQVPKYELETMINAITPENQHHLLLDGKQVGSEKW